ncbi:site-specific DNA-methyltransferase [Caldifermentibacillus hisashii]|uniref:site-specific DNA-methyltransferase n=1 Tax=Caldifermentibacillus hisashii TaxID=996558 RepID=UPI0034D4C56C
MTKKQQKLELVWIGKDKKPKLEPRILLEDKDYAYHANKKISDQDIFENRLIFGDNLLALKCLEEEFTEKIKCIYIDPPYNTGNALDYYDDGLEHSIWLSLMRDRLEILKKLLSPDGIMAIQIDDNEYARLYLLLVELFGQRNLKTISVKMAEPTGVKMSQIIKTGSIPKLKEYIILAGKNGVRNLNIEKIPKGKWDSEYKTFVDNVSKEEISILKEIIENENRTSEDIKTADEITSKFKLIPVGDMYSKLGLKSNQDKENWLFENAWRIVRTCSTTESAKKLADDKRETINGTAFTIVTPQNKMYVMIKDYNIKNKQPRIKLLFADDYLTVHPGDFWSDIKTTGLGNEGGVDFPKSKKPEALIKRIIGMCTNEGDWVLDSFAGSGTTGAVAHKMRRKWIMVELGEHCFTHIIPRMKRVIDGEDNGGITKAVNWNGGGGFRFYRVAPSLLEKDKYGNWIISKNYNSEMLAEAVCKLEGFNYDPDKNVYWKHGQSTENDFIYVTTQFVNQQLAADIADQMKEDETLLICCKAFNVNQEDFSNITFKKIPHSVLKKCEFGKDDYSLNVQNLPMMEKEPEQMELFDKGDVE